MPPPITSVQISPHDWAFTESILDLEVVVGALLEHLRRLHAELVEPHLEEADVVVGREDGGLAVGVVGVREGVVWGLDQELGGAKTDNCQKVYKTWYT